MNANERKKRSNLYLLILAVIGSGFLMACNDPTPVDTDADGCGQNATEDCSEDSFNFRSRSDIEEFCTNDCRQVSNLFFSGLEDVTSLKGFNHFENDDIRFHLDFRMLNGPERVDGFHGITDLGSLDFSGNHSVKEVILFENLERVRSLVEIENNSRLEKLTIFPNLLSQSDASRGNDFRIENNPMLREVGDMPLVREMGTLRILNNDSLETFGSLESLEEMHILHFADNPKLTSLPDLSSLKRVEYVIGFQNNPNLRLCEVEALLEQLEEPPQNPTIIEGLSDEPCD